jgi:hypothetical protein
MPATQQIPISSQQLLWVGCVFGGLLIIFFIAAFFYRGLDRGQWQILRTLGALCAGFCGGLFTGTALFHLNGEYNGLNLGISGAAGFAGFFTVWFTWPNYEQVVVQPDIATSIPAGFTFEQAVRHLADAKAVTVAFEGFDEEAKGAQIRPSSLVMSLPKALERLRLVAIHPDAIPEYKVVIEDSRFYKLVATMLMAK